MADDIKKVARYSAEVADQAGAGKAILDALAAGKADLLAIWAYPCGEKAKIEFIPADEATFRAACKAAKIKVKKECAAFCVVGRNKAGALIPVAAKLAEKGISVRAAQAIAVGSRFGAVLEVASKDARKAAKVLGI